MLNTIMLIEYATFESNRQHSISTRAIDLSQTQLVLNCIVPI